MHAWRCGIRGTNRCPTAGAGARTYAPARGDRRIESHDCAIAAKPWPDKPLPRCIPSDQCCWAPPTPVDQRGRDCCWAPSTALLGAGECLLGGAVGVFLGARLSSRARGWLRPSRLGRRAAGERSGAAACDNFAGYLVAWSRPSSVDWMSWRSSRLMADAPCRRAMPSSREMTCW